MKTILISIMLSLLSCVAFAGERWAATDKALAVLLVAGQTLNYAQTKYVYETHGWHELNPIMNFMSGDGRHVLEYKAGSTMLILMAAHYFPEHRRRILTLTNVVVFGFVGNDIRLGVKFKF